MSSAGCDDGVDLISDLCDDLLLHVLRFLPDAWDVVCTFMLSTRWRCLWTRVPVLHIGNWNCHGRRSMDGERFNDFMHNMLADRTHDIDMLDLYTSVWPGKSRADQWLDHAMRRTVRSLEFGVQGTPKTLKVMMGFVPDNRPQVDLPTATRVAVMSLNLGSSLRLPPVVEFRELTELTLSRISFSNDDGPSLGRLLSSPSCCPRLRKLTLSNLSGLHNLCLDVRSVLRKERERWYLTADSGATGEKATR